MNIEELHTFLKINNADYEIIRHSKPILSTTDAEGLFDITKAVPVFIMKTEKGYMALIVSGSSGRIDFKLLKQKLQLKKLSMAGREEVLSETGYEIGSIPLIGHNLPVILDKRIMETDYVYGGTGDAFYTLKINPKDVKRLNNVVNEIEL